VLCGAYFLLNLILAVIIEAYNSIDKAVKEKEMNMLEEKNRVKR